MTGRTRSSGPSTRWASSAPTFGKDGPVTATTEQTDNTTQVALDARGKADRGEGAPTRQWRHDHYQVTRYEYDQVGNCTEVITPRCAATTDHSDDFAQVTAYDQLNRGQGNPDARTTGTTPTSTRRTGPPTRTTPSAAWPPCRRRRRRARRCVTPHCRRGRQRSPGLGIRSFPHGVTDSIEGGLDDVGNAIGDAGGAIAGTAKDVRNSAF